MNPELRDMALAAADAAMRRLLVRTIDLRFDLEDAAAAFASDRCPGFPDLWRLRADAELLYREIDALIDAVSPADDGSPAEADEMSPEAAEACGA